MSFIALFAKAICSLLVLPALGLRAKAVLDVDSVEEMSKMSVEMQIVMLDARVAKLKLLAADDKNLWVSDELTGYGSNLPVAVNDPFPISTFYLGFDGCEGSKLLGEVLSMHPGTIVGNSLEKNYFTSKTKGHCNRFAAKQDATEYDKYLRSCFKGQIPTVNRTTLDFSQSYAENSFSTLVPKMEEMAEEANLRFLSVICEPRQRAVTATHKQLLARNESATYMTVDNISNAISHGLRKHRAGSYSGIIGAGEYSRVLSGWAESFPLASILVINSEHLNDIRTWKRIFGHIGLRVPSDWRLRHWLKAATTKTAEELETPVPSPDELEHFLKQRLDNHYSRYDAALWDMLDVKYW